MANFVLDISRQSSGVATIDAYRFAAFDTDQNLFDPTPTADGLVMGVVMTAVDESKVLQGATTNIRVLGVAPVEIGTGTAAPGSLIATGTDGKGVVTTTTGANVAGIALQDGTAGAIVDVMLTPGALAP